VRRKRKIRAYIQDGPTIEGIFAGRTRHAYLVWAPKIVTGDDTEPSVEVAGHVEIPRERVLYYQILD
jgi:hypothetical protein